jgi:hypothetical protein
MHIETLSADDPRWTAALSRLHHDFYHEPSYVRLDADRLQATPEALLVSEGERMFFVPYLMRSCGSLFSEMQESIFDVISPYGYPGALLSDAGRDAGFASAAFAAFKETLVERGVCSAFLRMHPILGNDFSTLFPAGTFTDASETVAVDLELDETTLWKQMRNSHQRILKKCSQLGYVGRFVPLSEVLDEFVAIYEQTMNRVQAKDSYYFSREYFTKMARMPGVHCCIVESGTTIAAACLFFERDGMVQAHLGGTRTEFFSTSPFHLTLFQATMWSKSRRNRWLHLGGGVGGGNDTLLNFKAGFSPVRFHFLTSRLIINETKYRQLVDLKSRAVHSTPESVLASSFFPAYRS